MSKTKKGETSLDDRHIHRFQGAAEDERFFGETQPGKKNKHTHHFNLPISEDGQVDGMTLEDDGHVHQITVKIEADKKS